MNRRQALLTGAAAVGAVALAARPATSLTAPAAAAAGQNDALARAALECVRAGDVCMEHCLRLLAKGDRSMSDCAAIVKQMVALCGTMGPFVASSGKHLKALARVCRDVCEDCRKECDRHANHHPECRACRDSCTAMLAELRKLG